MELLERELLVEGLLGEGSTNAAGHGVISMLTCRVPISMSSLRKKILDFNH